MGDAVVHFLSSLSNIVFQFAAVCFVIVNTAAVVIFVATQNRRLVNVWTSRLVTLDAVLIGAGLGVPVLSFAARLVVQGIGSLATGALALFK